MAYRQSNPDPAGREFIFHLTDTVTGLPKTGQTFATTDIQIRKSGGPAYVNADTTQQAAVVEIGGGDYVYTALATEIDTPGKIAFKVNKTGAQPWTTTEDVDRAYIGKAVTGTLTTNAFSSDRTEATANHWSNSLLLWLTGALAGQVQQVTAYVVAGGIFSFTVGFTGAPANGDIFEIIDR